MIYAACRCWAMESPLTSRATGRRWVGLQFKIDDVRIKAIRSTLNTRIDEALG